jgi:hypothetical protein
LYSFFLSEFFNKNNAILNKKPFVYIGKIPNKDINFISIDVHYFLNFIYMVTKREDRENLFHFFINRENNLNIGNIEKFVENINYNKDIFFPNNNIFISDVVYSFNSSTIKTKIIRIATENFNKLLDQDKDLKESFLDLKKLLDDKIKTVSFGKRAQDATADFENVYETFFRIPENECAKQS